MSEFDEANIHRALSSLTKGGKIRRVSQGVYDYPCYSELFSETAMQKITAPAVVEKEFLVTWVLNRLFHNPDLARLLMFEGDTSLFKVYQLMNTSH